MSDLNEIINKTQSIIDNLNFSSLITYENTIIPEATKILNVLNNTPPSKWVRRNDLSKRVDIYVEALAIHMLYTYTKGANFQYPLHAIAIVLIRHPYFINMFQCGKNMEDWKKFSSAINEEIISMFGETNSSSLINNLRETLKHDVKEDITTPSSAHEFHYLTDFTFEEDVVGLTQNELLTKLQEKTLIDDTTIFISINVAHNLHNLQSIVIYKTIPKLREKILNPSTMSSLNPFLYPTSIDKPTKDFYILNSKFEQIPSLPASFSKAFVLISYNDSEHHYSLAYFGESKSLTPEQARQFVDYKVLKVVNSEIFDYYLKEEFYNKIGSNKKDVNDLKKEYIRLIQLVSDTYSKSPNSRVFSERLLSRIDTLTIIDPHELPYFKLYLSKSIEPYDLPNVLSYTTSYIFPDLLVNSATL